MAIRLSEPSDANALARMGQAFFDGTPLSGLTEFDPASLFALITSGDNVATFVFEHDGEVMGAVSGVVYPLVFNQKYMVCQELFWWADPEARKMGAGKELHSHPLEWAKGMGAQAMMMIAIENDCVKKVERLYNYYGYRKLEHIFIKEI
mgnify:CR=1 FL=1